MELFHFKNSDWWKDARLVGMAPGEKPSGKPAADAAPEAGSKKTPDTAAEVSGNITQQSPADRAAIDKKNAKQIAKVAEQGEKGVDARRAGDRELAESGKKAEAFNLQKTNNWTEEEVAPVLEKFKKALAEKGKKEANAELSEEEKQMIDWADTELTEVERTQALAKAHGLLKDGWGPAAATNPIPNKTEIDRLSADGKIDYREALALKNNLEAVYRKGDEAEIAKTRMGYEAQDAYKTAIGLKEIVPDAVTGGGFMALLERLMKKFTILIDKIGNWISKQFGGKSKKAAGPETASTNKFKAEKYEAGKGVKINTMAGSEIPALVEGTIEEVDADKHTVTIKSGDGKLITYKNVLAASGVIKGAEIKKGQLIGKSRTDEAGAVTVQHFGADGNTEIDPTPLLTGLVEQEPTPLAPASGTPEATPPEGTVPGPEKKGAPEPEKPAEKTPEQIQQELKEKLTRQKSEAFKEFSGQTKGDINFKLPYISGTEIKTFECAIKGNEFAIDGKKFALKLANSSGELVSAPLKQIVFPEESDTSKTTVEFNAPAGVTVPPMNLTQLIGLMESLSGTLSSRSVTIKVPDSSPPLMVTFRAAEDEKALEDAAKELAAAKQKVKDQIDAYMRANPKEGTEAAFQQTVRDTVAALDKAKTSDEVRFISFDFMDKTESSDDALAFAKTEFLKTGVKPESKTAQAYNRILGQLDGLKAGQIRRRVETIGKDPDVKFAMAQDMILAKLPNIEIPRNADEIMKKPQEEAAKAEIDNAKTQANLDAIAAKYPQFFGTPAK